MELAVTSGKKARSSMARLAIRQAGAVVVGIALGGTAMAASTPAAPCEEVARNLQSLTVTPTDLVLQEDRLPGVASNIAVDGRQRQMNDEQSVTPLLYLTPRVAELLDSVFEDADPVAADAGIADGSPLSGNAPADLPESEIKSAPVTSIEKDDAVPLYQRRMFRTDI
jgi:hypothetical protein